MKILSLGGSQWQVGLIQTLNRLGHETYVIDINPECAGRSEAHHYIQGDTGNPDVVLMHARDNSVELVLAEQSDRFVQVAAYVNEVLGLPGLSMKTARRFTDKLEMRMALKDVVAMPNFLEVGEIEVALEFAVANGYPVILKPKSAQSSYGVFKVDDANALRGRFVETLSYSKDGLVLIEQYIDGPEITVEGLSIDGRFHALAVSEKLHYDFNPCVARRLSYPPRYSVQRMQAIYLAAAKVVEGLGLENGISHAEYRLQGDTPYLVEVAARGGGTKIASSIVPHVCQFDAYAVLVRRLAGEGVNVPAPAGKAAVLTFLDFAPGHVLNIRGLDQICMEGLAAEIKLNFEEGDEILRPSDDTQRLGYAIVLGEDRDEVDARCQRIQELLRVEYQ